MDPVWLAERGPGTDPKDSSTGARFPGQKGMELFHS